jgi:hypothetical protein
MNPYAVLQSGFLSPTNPLFHVSDPISAQIVNQQLKMGVSVKETLSPFHYHAELNNLFHAHTTNPCLLDAFDFRERLLQNIKNAIGLTSFYTWFLIQKNSPYLTNTHIQFMEDTLHYLDTGQRRVAVTSWLATVSARHTPNPDLKAFFSPHSYFERQVVRTFQSRQKELSNINTALVNWCAHPDGFGDLLYFSKIVFGETYARSVT